MMDENLKMLVIAAPACTLGLGMAIGAWTAANSDNENHPSVFVTLFLSLVSFVGTVAVIIALISGFIESVTK